MIILDMLNILRTHGINPSGITANLSSMPNHKLVNDIRKLRSKLNLQRYKEAQALYKKVIKPINIAFIRKIYSYQYYMGMNDNPLIDLENLFGLYDNNNIENPALYRLLKEHRLQRNLFKYIILTEFCKKPDNNITDGEYEDLIKKLEAYKDTVKDDAEIADVCRILEGLSLKKPEFFKLGLAIMTGGADTSLNALIVYCILAIKDKGIQESCKKLIKGVNKDDSKRATQIIERTDAVNADPKISQQNKPLFTNTVLNPISDVVEEANRIQDDLLSKTDSKKLEEIKSNYFSKILDTPAENNVKLIVSAAVRAGEADKFSSYSGTEKDSLAAELHNMKTYAAEELKVMLEEKAKKGSKAPPPPKLKIEESDLQEIIDIKDFYDLQTWHDAKDSAWIVTGDNDKLLKKVNDILEAHKWLITGDGTNWKTNWGEYNWNSRFLNAVKDASNIKDRDGETVSIPKLEALVEPMYVEFYKNLVENVLDHERNQMDSFRTELQDIKTKKNKTDLLDFMDAFIKKFSDPTSFIAAINIPIGSFSRSNFRLKNIITDTVTPLQNASDKFRLTVIDTLTKIRAQFNGDYSSAYDTVNFALGDIVNSVADVPTFEGEVYKDVFKQLIQEQIAQLQSLKINDSIALIYGELKRDADAMSSMPEIQILEIIADTDSTDIKRVLDKIVTSSGMVIYDGKNKVMFGSKTLDENELEDIKQIMLVYINNTGVDIDLKSIENTTISFLGLRFVIVEDKTASVKSLVDLYDSVPNPASKLTFLTLKKKVNLDKLINLVKSSKLFVSINAGKKDTPTIYMDSEGVCFETTVSVWKDLGTYLHTDDKNDYHEFGLLDTGTNQRIYYPCKKVAVSGGNFNFIVGEENKTSIDTTNMTGGAYYKKYLKYKSKYLQIK